MNLTKNDYEFIDDIAKKVRIPTGTGHKKFAEIVLDKYKEQNEVISREEVDNLFKLILMIAVKVGINEQEVTDYLRE